MTLDVLLFSVVHGSIINIVRSHIFKLWENDLTAAECSFLLQFAQQEEKRQKAERLQQQQKHEMQTKDMIAQCESNMNELQQLQVT